jgi:hypothetical protein
VQRTGKRGTRRDRIGQLMTGGQSEEQFLSKSKARRVESAVQGPEEYRY